MDEGTWSREDHGGNGSDLDSDDESFADADGNDAVAVEAGAETGETKKVKNKFKKAKDTDKEKKKKKKSKEKKEKKKKKKKQVDIDDNDDESPMVSPETKKKKKKKVDVGKAEELISPLKSPKKKKKSKKTDKHKSKEKKSKTKKSKKKTESESLDPHQQPLEDLSSTAFKVDQIDYVEDPVEDDGDDSEAERMKNMLAQWDDSDASTSSDDSDKSENEEDEDDDEDKLSSKDKPLTKADLGLKDNEIDHIILAAPDYEEAVKEFETMTGIKPARLGGLKGLGIRAARVATDSNCYIEILAPDPNKAGPIGAKLSELEEGTLIPYHYAIRQSDFDELQEEIVPNQLGYIPDRINLYSIAPDDSPAKWGMLFMQGHFLGGAVPYYVDWGGCIHPMSSIPTVGPLKNLTITAPGGSQVHNLLRDIEHVTTEEGDPRIEFSIGTPEGIITFSADDPKGLVFPGAGESTQGQAAAPRDGDEEDARSDESDSESDDDSDSHRDHSPSDDENDEPEDDTNTDRSFSDSEDDEKMKEMLANWNDDSNDETKDEVLEELEEEVIEEIIEEVIDDDSYFEEEVIED